MVTLNIGCSGLLDETPPSPPYNLKGYFTLTQNNPRVNISWTHSVDDDISTYQVFKSIDEGVNFEYLGESGSNIIRMWTQQHFGLKYFLQSKSER